MKKLPKAQLGRIIKGIIKVGAPAGKKVYKAAKIVKPASKIVKPQTRNIYKYESPIETINRQIKEGVITKGSGYNLPSGRRLNKNQKDISIPAYIATYGGGALLAAWAAGAFNKKKTITIKKKKIIKKKP